MQHSPPAFAFGEAETCSHRNKGRMSHVVGSDVPRVDGVSGVVGTSRAKYEGVADGTVGVNVRYDASGSPVDSSN